MVKHMCMTFMFQGKETVALNISLPETFNLSSLVCLSDTHEAKKINNILSLRRRGLNICADQLRKKCSEWLI